jgi:hypothetical protein
MKRKYVWAYPDWGLTRCSQYAIFGKRRVKTMNKLTKSLPESDHIQELKNKKPYINERIFWDINIAKLDYDRDKLLITERALVKGTEEDEFALYEYYGKENMKKILMEVTYLDSITIEYVSQIFNIPKEKMKCYIKK